MYVVDDRKLSTHLDLSQTAAARFLATWTKTAIGVTLVLVIVCAVLAVEIELLHTGALVVVMPE